MLLILTLTPGSEPQGHLHRSLSLSVRSLETLVFLYWGVCVAAAGAGVVVVVRVVGETPWREGYLTHPEHR